MSDQQMAELYERLVAAKFKEGRPAFEYPFQRGVNTGLDIAIRALREVCDEPSQPAQSEAAE